MNRKIVASLILALMVSVLPGIVALGGTPPIPQCSIDLTIPSGTIAGSTPIVRQLVDRVGNVYLLWNEATPDLNGVIVGKISSYSPACGLRWSRTEDCGGAGETRVCSVGTQAPYMDYYTNSLLVSVSYFDDGCLDCSVFGTNYRWHAIDRSNGLTIARSNNITTTTSLDSSGAASYFNGTTINWVFTRFEGASDLTESFVASTDEPLALTWASAQSNRGEGQFYQNLAVQGNSLGICSGGAAQVCSLLDTDDGSTLGTFANGDGNYYSFDAPKRIGTSDIARYRNVGVNGTLAYKNVTLSTWTASAVVNPVPDNVPGFGSAGNEGGWDIDANGDILMCGEVASYQRIWLSHVKPLNRTQYWNTGASLSATQESAIDCNFDFIGGIWWSGFYVDALGRAHIFAFRDTIPDSDPGAFVSPTPPSTITDFTGEGDILPGGEQLPPESINVIDSAVDTCSDAFGFDCSVLFGIFLTVGFAITIGAATKGAPLGIGGGLFLGVIAAVMMGLFAEWVIFIIAFVVIAISGAVMFEGRRSR